MILSLARDNEPSKHESSEGEISLDHLHLHGAALYTLSARLHRREVVYEHLGIV